jgi:hypothetical protein
MRNGSRKRNSMELMLWIGTCLSLLALSGGGPYSCAITDDNRPTLTAFSHLALKDYNQRNHQVIHEYIYSIHMECLIIIIIIN